jgi:hypothetical protein
MGRCTSCSHRWFVAHDALDVVEDREDSFSDALLEDQAPLDARPAAPPPLDRAPALAGADMAGAGRPEPLGSRSTAATVGWLAVLLILLVLTGLVLGRNEVVALAPQTAPLYQRMGLPVTQAIGLEISGIVSERLAGEDGDVLRITGSVQNVAGAERAVPPLRIALLDAAREEVLVQEVELPQPVLAHGASTRFSVDLAEPPAAARNFSVTFAVAE